MTKILMTYPADEQPVRYGDKPLSGLRRLGEVRLNPHSRPMTPDEVVAAAADCPVIVADRSVPFDAATLARLPRLVAVVRAAMDVRNIDIPAASKAGILVTRAGPGFRDGVVELLLGQMVDLARGMSYCVGEYHAGRMPERRSGLQLAGRTASILGYGNLGRRMAEVLAFLGMRVLVHDPNVASVEAPAQLVDRERALAEGDFVICLVIHNKDTDQSMNRAVFARMKRSAYFLNPSRGPVVDEAALEHALRNGTIAGAALDVGSDPDDVPPVKLARLPNVLAAPHIGGMVPEAMEAQALDTVDQVAAILDGQLPKYALNAEHAHRLKPTR
jgi:D-3-phosphoglycerate dehydrogenase / 2-oxoglutarate reductase